MSLNPERAAAAAALGPIADDPRSLSPQGDFRRGWVSFAGGGVNSRTNQLFITYRDMAGLGKSPWETPIGVVVEGMDVVDAFNAEYGDMPPWGKGPDQGMIHRRGAQYLNEEFPKLDYIVDCRIDNRPSTRAADTTAFAPEVIDDGETLPRSNWLFHRSATIVVLATILFVAFLIFVNAPRIQRAARRD